MMNVKRLNDWPAAVKVADELAAALGVRFRVRRDRFAVYGFRWWVVEPTVPVRRRSHAATVEELRSFAEKSAETARRRRAAHSEAPRTAL